MAEQMLEEARSVAMRVSWPTPTSGRVGSSTFLVEPQEAEGRFELAIARLTPELDVDFARGSRVRARAIDPRLSALIRWTLGYPERHSRAPVRRWLAQSRGGTGMGRRLSALGSMTLFLLRSDAETLSVRAEPGHRLCQQEGIGWWQDYLEVFLGRLAVMSGDLDAGAGIARMRSAIAGWQGKGMVVGTDDLSSVLADGCLDAARREWAVAGPMWPATTHRRAAAWRLDWRR